MGELPGLVPCTGHQPTAPLLPKWHHGAQAPHRHYLQTLDIHSEPLIEKRLPHPSGSLLPHLSFNEDFLPSQSANGRIKCLTALSKTDTVCINRPYRRFKGERHNQLLHHIGLQEQ